MPLSAGRAGLALNRSKKELLAGASRGRPLSPCSDEEVVASFDERDPSHFCYLNAAM